MTRLIVRDQDTFIEQSTMRKARARENKARVEKYEQGLRVKAELKRDIGVLEGKIATSKKEQTGLTEKILARKKEKAALLSKEVKPPRSTRPRVDVVELSEDE